MNYSTPRSFIFMLLGIMGASIGALIYFWGTPSTPESQAFITSPEFIIWFFLNEVLFAFYPILMMLIWKPLNQLRKQLRRNIIEILGSSLILFVLFMLPQFVGMAVIKLGPLPLEYAEAKMLIFMSIGFFASILPLTLGILLTQAAIRDVFRASPPAEYPIRDYLRFRDYLQQFLMFLGAGLSIYILVIAALRAAALSSEATTASHYPSIYLLILGVYNSLLIAIVYFPAYLSLVSVGEHLLDVYFALPDPSSKEWTEKYSGRKQLEELLELKFTGEQRFVTAITLLSPFVSGILSLLVGK